VNIGIISDTHGKLDPRILPLFEGVEHILHAGDVGGPEIVRALETVAPVTAVIGNMDWCVPYRLFERREFGGRKFLITHQVGDPGDPLRQVREKVETEKPDVVVFGHTHVMCAERHSGVLFFNPGSASRRKAGHPLSIARIEVGDGRLDWKFIDLDDLWGRR
jgi:putative phosphoesterase